MDITFILGFVGATLVVLATVGGILYQGIVKISASPPYVGLVTFLGKPIERVKEAGWRFFFLKGLVYDFIPIKAEKVNDDQIKNDGFVILVRTPHPDNVELKLTIHFTYQADWQDPAALIKLNEAGLLEGAAEILVGIVEQEIREWASSKERGPKNWQEAIALNDDATNVIIDSIISSELGKSEPYKYPILVFMKYFGGRDPSETEQEHYGKNWEKIEAYIDSLSDDQKERLVQKTKEREEQLTQMKAGNGYFAKKSIGICINRINIGEIIPTNKELVESAELKAKEERERDAEEIEIKHVNKQIKRLIRAGFTREEAKELFQTERGKVTKNVQEHKISIAPETQGMLKEAVSFLPFLNSSKKKGGGKK
jgi:hypothetical protein